MNPEPQTRGGKRAGAGAPKKHPQDVKHTHTIRLPKKILGWLAAQETPSSVLIEQALIAHHEITFRPRRKTPR